MPARCCINHQGRRYGKRCAAVMARSLHVRRLRAATATAIWSAARAAAHRCGKPQENRMPRCPEPSSKAQGHWRSRLRPIVLCLRPCRACAERGLSWPRPCCEHRRSSPWRRTLSCAAAGSDLHGNSYSPTHRCARAARRVPATVVTPPMKSESGFLNTRHDTELVDTSAASPAGWLPQDLCNRCRHVIRVRSPLTPITLSDVFVILRVEVERCHRLDILFSQPRSPYRALRRRELSRACTEALLGYNFLLPSGFPGGGRSRRPPPSVVLRALRLPGSTLRWDDALEKSACTIAKESGSLSHRPTGPRRAVSRLE